MGCIQYNPCVIALLVIVAVIAVLSDDTDATTPESSEGKKGTPQSPPTSNSIEEVCAQLNSSSDPCNKCVSNAKCLYCYSPLKCVPYPIGQLIPRGDICDLSQARWASCFVNYKVLLICLGSIAAIVLVAITSCCVYCCCCRNNKANRNKYLADEMKWENERTSRQTRNQERRKERQSTLDNIRRKYGLMKDDSTYQRFDE